MKSSEQKHSSKGAQQPSEMKPPFFEKSEQDVFAREQQMPSTAFFATIQPKLKIHPANDPYEKEADAVADKVIKPNPLTSSFQRKEKSNESTVSDIGISSVQRQRAFESPSALEQNSANQESELLQTKSEANTGDTSSIESQLRESKGNGSGLPVETREKMESGIGADFSGVHIHNDDRAAQLNNQLGAKAFTHGSDIYFNKGEYQPSTQAGDHLIAHELTHTVQQGAAKSGAIQRKENTQYQLCSNAIGPPPPHGELTHDGKPRTKTGTLSDNGDSADPPDISSSGGNEVIQKAEGTEGDLHDGETGKVTRASNSYTLEVKEIKVPDFKLAATNKGTLEIPTVERSNNQISDWEKGVDAGKVDTVVNDLVKGPPVMGDNYFFKYTGGFLIGPKAEIKKKVIRPFWDLDGKYHAYHVDHIHEFQIGGPDKFGNLWLLDAKINVASGKAIKKEKDNRIKALIDEAVKKSKFWPKGKPSLNEVKAGGRFKVKFSKAVGGLPGFGQLKDKDKYSEEDIYKGNSIKGLKPLTDKELEELGVKGADSKNITLFLRPQGGAPRKISKTNPAPIHLGNLGIQPAKDSVKVDPNTYKILDGSKLQVEIFRSNDQINKTLKSKNGQAKKFDVTVYSLGGLPNLGYVNSQEWSKMFKDNLDAAGLSPLEIEMIDIDDKAGLIIRGKIKPSVPIIANADISFVINGNDIYIEKTFTANEFKVPAPFKINSCSLTVRAGTMGLELEGDVNFEIQRVGEGSVSAFINSRKEFGVRGEFTFDKKLFDNAKVKVSYLDQKWAVEGTIQIPPKKLKGIKRASATIAYTEGTLSASGTVEPDIKGVKEGSFDLKYSEEQFIINGKLQLADIPRLKKGEISVTVENKGEGYKLKGSGIAEFDIPGINSGLSVSYDDGLLTIEASVTFEKGIAKGEVKAGATNRPIDSEGRPTGEPGSKWTFYGSGKLTVKITPWLQATAGVKFLPNGELEVLGRIELPSAVDVFKRKAIKEPLFTMPTVEIPIFAIPLGPKSLGIVAQINGGLDFEAGVGPGQIKDLFGEIKYNPSRPEETTLAGGGKFVIPADASLKLHGDLSLGLSVGIASLTGGIEIAASVGLQGEASAEVRLDWNPTSGLELNAVGQVKVSPRFKFDVNLLARAKLDLWIKTFKKEWRYNLASYEWGPGFDFGIRFPIHYKEGEPFDISFKDIEVIKPNIDILGTAKGLAKDIKNKVF